MNCIFTSKERPFCWGNRKGFCKFLRTPDVVDRSIKNKPKIFFTCQLENEKLFSSIGKKTCKWYSKTIKKSSEIIKELRKDRK